MPRFSTCLTHALAVLMLGSALLLSACQCGCKKCHTDMLVKPETPSAAHFDATIKARSSGQFELDGAVLSAADLSSHFAYQKEIGQLPKTVLLLPSDVSNISKQHLQYMARMMLDYGFLVYYKDHHTLKKIHPIQGKAQATRQALRSAGQSWLAVSSK